MCNLQGLGEVVAGVALTMLWLRGAIRVDPPAPAERRRRSHCNLDCEACNVMVHGLDASGRRAAGLKAAVESDQLP